MTRKDYIQAIFLYLLFGLLTVGVLAFKRDYHIDELFSYALANDAYNMTVEQGVAYEPAAQPYLNNLTAASDDRFDYAMVWDNQTKDVHPPLYYLLLHTLCSFFPGKFSVWFAGLINICFALGTLFVFRRLVGLYTNSNFILLASSIFLVASAGILSSVSFLRMYIMAMFWVTLTAYLLAETMISEKMGRAFYIRIFVTAVLGALTHYYCIVYLVLSCVVFGIWLLYRKKWKEIVWFVIVMGASAGGAVLLFPAMTEHMFSGYRGVQSIENLSGMTAAEYWGRIRDFGRMLDNQVFGGLLWIFIVFIFAAAVRGRKRVSKASAKPAAAGRGKARKGKKSSGKRREPDRRQDLGRWLILIVPVTVYFLLVSKMAVYVTERYLVPVYAVVMALAAIGLQGAVSVFAGTEKSRRGFVIIGLAALLIGTWYKADWPTLYLAETERLRQAQEYSDVNAIIVYNTLWRTKPAFMEALNYRSLTFVQDSNMELVDTYAYANDDEILLLTIGDGEQILNAVMSKLPHIDSYERIGGFSYHTTYRLYKTGGSADLQ